MHAAPTVIVKSRKSVDQRPECFVDTIAFAQLKVASAKTYRKVAIAYTKWRVYDISLRSWGGSNQCELKWFRADVHTRYSGMRVWKDGRLLDWDTYTHEQAVEA